MKDLKELTKISSYADQCMKCGFCSFFCPVYQEEKTETAVARGKNYLVKQVLAGNQEFTPELGEIISKCLLCKRCVANCPSKTQIDRVVVAARAQMVKDKGLGFIKNFLFRRVMANRKTFGRMVKLAQTFQWLLPRTEGNIRHLPDFLKALGHKRNIPTLAKTFLRDQVKPRYKPQGTPVMKVGFFMGCATDFIYPDLGLKLIDFLVKHNVEVVVPDAQNCCGAAIYFSGDFETGRMLAEKNIEAFFDVDYIVTACGTCSSTLKDYQKYLPDTEDHEEALRGIRHQDQGLNRILDRCLENSPGILYPEEGVRGEDSHLARSLPPHPLPEHQGSAPCHPQSLKGPHLRGDAQCGHVLRHGRLLQCLPLRPLEEDRVQEDGRDQGNQGRHRGHRLPRLHDQPRSITCSRTRCPRRSTTFWSW